MQKKNKLIFPLLILIFSHFPLFSQEKSFIINTEKLPLIDKLQSNNTLFKEYTYIVNDNYKLLSAGVNPDYIFFKCIVPSDMNLLQLAARCNISYDTIATINRIENSQENISGKTLILPTVNGLFIKKPVKGSSSTSIEVILQEEYRDSLLTKENLCYKIDGKDFYFLLNQRFSPTERFYFLDSSLQLPLDKDSFWISSDFGKRKNPFSGEWKDHKGTDFAAAEGSPVYAVKDGQALHCIQNDPVFGNYIILSHDKGKMTSVYAHLSKMAIKKYDSVKKGDIIGFVGKTGMATGAHLHFEIRQGGIPLDPKQKLKLN